MAGYDPVPLWAFGGAQYGAAGNVIKEIAEWRWSHDRHGIPAEPLTAERVANAGATGAAVGLAAGVGLWGADRATRNRTRARAKPKAAPKAAAAPAPPQPTKPCA